MANKYTIAYIENGKLKINDPPYFAKLHRQELRAIAKRLFENANRRLINLRANKLTVYSEAATALLPIIGKAFHAKGLTDKELIDRIRLADWFLRQPTATVKGAKMVAKDVAARLPNLTPNERREFYRFNTKLAQLYPQFFEAIRSNQYSSNQYREYRETVIRNSRGSVLGGLGGDLFSIEGKEIKASAKERAAAIEKAFKDIEQYVKSEMDRMYPPINGKPNWSPMFSRAEFEKMRRRDLEIESLD